MSSTSLFGAWLKTRRRTLDLRQEDLADLIGCSLKTIEKIEAGERRPSRQVAELLAEHLLILPDEHGAFIRFARLERDPYYAHDSFPQATSPHDASDPRHAHAPWRTLHHLFTNLPAQPTPLIGRDADITSVVSLLQRDRVRLLTLVGPPGVGKTSLGIAVSGLMIDHFEDGVYMVSLAPIADHNLVVGAIAQALGIKEAGMQPLSVLVTDYLQSKRLLLLLDNFEQVLEAGTYVASLVSACPWLKVLVTSRAALRVRGERQVEVAPLDLPNPTEYQSVVAVERSPAVALFVERAQAVQPNFSLTDSNAATVASICAQLDGLPLAIELAAAHAKLLSPSDLLSRLNSRLALLTGGPRDLSARHKTLRAAIAWSYDLLQPDEQTLFARIGVFVGGCTLSAVEAVCNAQDDLAMSVLEGVGLLLDKSMLKQQRDEGIRGERPFTMLETTREYALERLVESGEIGEILRLHAEYYLALVEAAEPELRGPDQLAWFNRLEIEHDNIRAALEWSQEAHLAPEASEIGLRIASSMYPFWMVRGYWSEGRLWLQSMLAKAVTATTSVRAKAIVRLSYMTWHLADFEAAGILGKEGLAMYRALGDKAGIAYALLMPGLPEHDSTLLHSRQEESLELYRELGDKEGISRTLYRFAQMAYSEGMYDQARIFCEQSLSLHRETGDRWGAAYPMAILGQLVLLKGHYAAARALFEECLTLQQELGDKRLIARSLNRLGEVAKQEGDYSRAEGLFKDSLLIFKEIGAQRQMAECMAVLAEVACAQEQPERAATLFGASEAIRATIKHILEPDEQAEYDRNIAATCAQLAGEVFKASWAKGNVMNAQQVIAYVMEAE